MTAYDAMPSPVGPLLLTADDAGLTRVLFAKEDAAHVPDPSWIHVKDATGEPARILRLARTQLDEYFAGTRRGFDVPLAATGTPFQKSVWDALCGIGWGEAISYAELARRIGNPTAVRAVGGANGRNPISIVVPCHRVIGADGSLTGFGGGMERKRWLLAHEGSIEAPQLAL